MLTTKRSRSIKRLLTPLLVSSCIACAMMMLRVPETSSSRAEGSNAGTIAVAPGSLTQRELAAGAGEMFAVAADAGQLLRFSIDKGDLVLSTTLYGPRGAKLLEHVSQDLETVDLSFPIEVTGTYRMELRSLEKTGNRKYELKVQPLTTLTALNRKDSEARQAMAHAEVLRANWIKTSLGQATELFDNAAVIWRSFGDFANASRATLKSGDTYFHLSQYSEARKRFQDALTLAQKTDDWIGEARALSQLARLDSYLGNNNVAQRHLNGALNLLNRDETNSNPDARSAHGEARMILGELVYARGNLKKALTHFDEAQTFFDGNRKGQAKVHLFRGFAVGSLGSPEEGAAEVSHALDLYRATNDKIGEGLALSTMGLADALSQKDVWAIDSLNAAREIFRTVGDRHSEAIALNGLGLAYEHQKDYTIAFSNYKDALQLFQEISSVDGASQTLCSIADIHSLSGDSDQALIYYERCLSLSRSAGKTRTEAFALTKIAALYALKGDNKRALNQHQKILNFYESIGDRRGLATALNVYAELLLKTEDKRRALDIYQRALSLSEQIGDQPALLSTLYNLAHVNLVLGSPDVALPFIQHSLEIIEDRRANVASPEFRTSYFSGVRNHYELCIEILMQLDRLHPGEGFGAKAFLVSEKSRARLLVDLVSESRAGIREGAAKELLDRERKLRGLIRSQAEYQLDLSSSGKDPAELAEVENQLVQLRTDYQQVEGQVRQQSPYLLSLEQFAPLSLEQIQHELRNSDTMLLEYSLGDDHSYLWAVTSESSQIYQLAAGRKDIAVAVREYHQLLTMRQESGSEYQAKVEAAERGLPEIEDKLSKMLLGQVADKLGSRRLIVVTEGALQLIPFDDLRVPKDSGAKVRLLETNEIVVEPSFSALVAIRNSRNEHASSPGKLVAIIADPVVNASDERVHTRGLSSSTAFAASEKKLDESSRRDAELVRLTHASEEADAISEVAPWGTTMVVKGFDASRETAMGADVGQYQIVHFASHGVVNSEHPELSSIVLTMVDRNGVNKNGLVSLHDIYSLDLTAELTVLSACQTALGKDIRGEGFVGLAHAFMSAGSKSVVASLWKVDDRATAVLMKDFYEAMLQKGMSPAAALREAKLKMMRDKQWNAPYYWAGFVLQGEYTNRISVDHHPWLRPRVVILFLLVLSAATIFVLQRRKRRHPPTQLK